MTKKCTCRIFASEMDIAALGHMTGCPLRECNKDPKERAGSVKMEATEQMKQMLDRIREEHWPNFDEGVLAAIMEIQSRLVAVLEDERVEIDAANPNEIDVECNALIDRCLAAIRAGEHYEKES